MIMWISKVNLLKIEKFKIMRNQSELELVKKFIDSTYSRFGNMLMVNTEKPFNPDNPELGYCFKYKDSISGNVIYKIVCSEIGIPRTDFRILMHEYGHIYLGHLDGIHEELDTQICNTFRDYRGELIDRINKECGIDFAEKLIERVIDDPVLNHSLHNIAMDMEVNSKILSTEDVEEMESDISGVLPDYQLELLKYNRDHVEDEEQKKILDEAIKKMENEAKIKLIVPQRYYIDENTPFPDELSYPEYLMLIIKHLDQFVKMLVSIKNGGNGDTSQVTSQDIQDALQGNGQGNGSGQGQEGGMQGLSDLMQEMGMSDGNGQGNGKGQGQGQGDKTTPKDCPYKGKRDSGTGDLNSNGKDEGGTHKDHRSDSRDDADRKRQLGQIRSGGGVGCGSSGGPDATRLVDKADEVDMALDEVMLNYKSRVIKVDTKKDFMYLYNRGINRSVIAPTYRRRVTISNEPTIVFLIDVSGSMDTRLVDRILNTIANKMKKIGRGLKYNIISWSTQLGEHVKNIDPRKGVPRISMGGGTRMAKGIKYFRENYGPEAILILISDFEDYLEEWHEEEQKMSNYTMYGFNYGYSNYKQEFKYFKVKNFTNNGGY